MYERVKRLYLSGRLSDTGLDNAVEKGWITDGQKTDIRKSASAGE